MNAGVCGVNLPSIRSKADLMKYCLENSAKRNKYGYVVGHNFEKAQRLFDFVTSQVSLPDVEAQAGTELYGALAQLLGGSKVNDFV